MNPSIYSNHIDSVWLQQVESYKCMHEIVYNCDPASQNQQKVAWPSFVLWLEIGDQGQHG